MIRIKKELETGTNLLRSYLQVKRLQKKPKASVRPRLKNSQDEVRKKTNMGSVTISNILSRKSSLSVKSSVKCNFSVKIQGSKACRKIKMQINPEEFVSDWTSKEVVAFNDKTEITSIQKICKHPNKRINLKTKMAFKLRNTAEGVSSKFALFILPPTDVGVERLDYVKYAPNNSISPQGNIKFEVPNDGWTYVDLASTRLSIKGRMKHRLDGQVEWTFLDSDPIPFVNEDVKTSRVGLVNAFAPSLFKAVDIKIGSENYILRKKGGSKE